jgi:hypothetical protein
VLGTGFPKPRAIKGYISWSWSPTPGFPAEWPLFSTGELIDYAFDLLLAGQAPWARFILTLMMATCDSSCWLKISVPWGPTVSAR